MKVIDPLVVASPAVSVDGVITRTPSPFTIAAHHLTSTNVGTSDFTGFSPAESVAVGVRRQTADIQSTVTLTIASPCVVSWSRHMMFENDMVRLTTTGALPTGLTDGDVYYARNVEANSFQIALKPDGEPINTSGSQSGTHTAQNTGHSVFESLQESFQGTASLVGTTLTVTAVATGSISVGMWLYGTSVATYQRIKSFITGDGGTGTYEVDISEPTIGSRTMFARASYSDTAHWVRVGSVNHFKMHDSSPSSATKNAGTIVNQYTIDGGRAITGMAFINLNAETVRVKVTDSGAGVVYDETQNGEALSNLTGKTERHSAVIFTDLPGAYTDVVIDVTITATGETASCGAIIMGDLTEFGSTQFGIQFGYQDFSQFQRDTFGNESFVIGSFISSMTLTAHLSNDDLDVIFKKLVDFRARPVVYIGADHLRSSVILGRPLSPKVRVPYPSESILSAEIESFK